MPSTNPSSSKQCRRLNPIPRNRRKTKSDVSEIVWLNYEEDCAALCTSKYYEQPTPSRPVMSNDGYIQPLDGN